MAAAPSAAAVAPGVVTATAGPARFDESDAGLLGGSSWDDYVRETAQLGNSRFVRLTRPHPRASSAARYGLNLMSRGKNVGWVLDGDPERGYWIVIDENASGELSDDPVRTLTRGAADWRADVATAPRVEGGPPTRFIVAFDGKRATSYEMSLRTGQLMIDGRPLGFTIVCMDADCSLRQALRVGFDLDGDGNVDVSSGSYERYDLQDAAVVAFGRSYDFDVTAGGSRLTLRRSKVARAPRPTLRPGSAAPVFEAHDDHVEFSLVRARGRVVLLDFYAEGCHFCVEDMPWVVEVHARHAAAGLEVVTLAAEAAPTMPTAWPTIVEPSPGRVAALYRVEAYPTYFVIDRDGTIACARCRRAEADRTLAQLLAKRAE